MAIVCPDGLPNSDIHSNLNIFVFYTFLYFHSSYMVFLNCKIPSKQHVFRG